MTQLARICAAALIAILPACSAQTANHKKRPDPKPEPTAPELFEYIRGSLLTLSPDDGINDNLEVTFNWTTNVMTIAQPSGHCDHFLNALNTNNVVWDVFDPSDAHQTRDKLVRVTLVSVSGTKARVCYDKMNNVDSSVPTNRVRLLFSITKAEGVPGFQDKMTKALKKLIVLSGGAPENKLF
ncbi:MAG TPA: hypothetical protein VGT08_15310 [Terracidiphilus sp.]|nr:hypothetical protein [Terracidiphilus sp.]